MKCLGVRHCVATVCGLAVMLLTCATIRGDTLAKMSDSEALSTVAEQLGTVRRISDMQLADRQKLLTDMATRFDAAAT